MQFQVECARCGTRYAPPTFSNLYKVSRDWSLRNGGKIFSASFKEPKTGNVWCPQCFPDLLQQEMGKRPASELIDPSEPDFKPFIDQKRVEEAQFLSMMNMYQHSTEEMLLIKEMYTLNLGRV